MASQPAYACGKISSCALLEQYTSQQCKSRSAGSVILAYSLQEHGENARGPVFRPRHMLHHSIAGQALFFSEPASRPLCWPKSIPLGQAVGDILLGCEPQDGWDRARQAGTDADDPTIQYFATLG